MNLNENEKYNITNDLIKIDQETLLNYFNENKLNNKNIFKQKIKSFKFETLDIPNVVFNYNYKIHIDQKETKEIKNRITKHLKTTKAFKELNKFYESKKNTKTIKSYTDNIVNYCINFIIEYIENKESNTFKETDNLIINLKNITKDHYLNKDDKKLQSFYNSLTEEEHKTFKTYIEDILMYINKEGITYKQTFHNRLYNYIHSMISNMSNYYTEMKEEEFNKSQIHVNNN